MPSTPWIRPTTNRSSPGWPPRTATSPVGSSRSRAGRSASRRAGGTDPGATSDGAGRPTRSGQPCASSSRRPPYQIRYTGPEASEAAQRSGAVRPAAVATDRRLPVGLVAQLVEVGDRLLAAADLPDREEGERRDGNAPDDEPDNGRHVVPPPVGAASVRLQAPDTFVFGGPPCARHGR